MVSSGSWTWNSVTFTGSPGGKSEGLEDPFFNNVIVGFRYIVMSFFSVIYFFRSFVISLSFHPNLAFKKLAFINTIRDKKWKQ